MRFHFDDKNIDISKGNAGLEHVYTPACSWNREDPKVTVTCRHLKTGESVNFLMTSPDGSSVRFDFRKLFRSQVISIENLIVNGTAITDAKTLLDLRNTAEFSELISDVGSHLVAGTKLTSDEIKTDDRVPGKQTRPVRSSTTGRRRPLLYEHGPA